MALAQAHTTEYILAHKTAYTMLKYTSTQEMNTHKINDLVRDSIQHYTQLYEDNTLYSI